MFNIILYTVCVQIAVSEVIETSTPPILTETAEIPNRNPPSWNCRLPQGRYICKLPPISNETQALSGCQPNNTVKVPCHPLANDNWKNFCPGVDHPANGTEIAFYEEIKCRYTNGYKFSVSLFLSVFFGLIGVDRFYLGHYTLGFLKMATAGLGGIWYAVDVIFISLQIVGPVDGSFYVMDYFGPIMERLGDFY